VSTLLLENAFKPAMPLTNGMITDTLQQLAPLSDISQGNVATYLSDDIAANFPLILTVKQIRKSVNI